VPFTEYYLDDQLKEDEMGWSWSTNGTHLKCILSTEGNSNLKNLGVNRRFLKAALIRRYFQLSSMKMAVFWDGKPCSMVAYTSTDVSQELIASITRAMS
jgi:hypothetical protein